MCRGICGWPVNGTSLVGSHHVASGCVAPWLHWHLTIQVVYAVGSEKAMEAAQGGGEGQFVPLTVWKDML